MRKYNELFYYENKKSLKTLSNFADMVYAYFDEVTYEFFAEVRETEKAQALRREINLQLASISKILESTETPSSLVYVPPAAVGGKARSINLLHDIFHLHLYSVGPQHIIDAIDRSQGVLLADQSNARLRTYNPLFWLLLFSRSIAKFFFSIVEISGFNREQAENSTVGKIFSFLVSIMTIIGAAFTILSVLLTLIDKPSLIQSIKNIFGL